MISKLKITTASLNAVSGWKKRNPPKSTSKSPFPRKKDLSLSMVYARNKKTDFSVGFNKENARYLLSFFPLEKRDQNSIKNQIF